MGNVNFKVHELLQSVLCRDYVPYSHGHPNNPDQSQRYTYRVLHTIQMKLILLCDWAERAVLGSGKTALKFKYEI